MEKWAKLPSFLKHKCLNCLSYIDMMDFITRINEAKLNPHQSHTIHNRQLPLIPEHLKDALMDQEGRENVSWIKVLPYM